MTASLPLAVALLLTAVSPRDTQEAERLAKQSITDYNLGDFTAALNSATKAYRLDPRPEFLYNLGQCYRALRQWERAEFFYRGYLREKPDAFNREIVLGLIADMKRKQEVARLEPPPVPKVLVVPPPPVVPPPVPVAATKTEPAAEKSHSHVLGITLGAVGIASLVAAAAGEGYVVHFNQVNSQIAAGLYTGTYSAAASAQSSANTGGTVALTMVIVAAVAITGAVLTW